MKTGAWRWGMVVAIGIAVTAACSGNVSDEPAPSAPAAEASSPTSSTPAPAPPTTYSGETEVAREDVGPGGGTISSGSLQVKIPPGALAATTTIVVKELDVASVTLPPNTSVIGKVYRLEPDDVTFAEPVTIRIGVDRATRPLVGSIDLARSVKAANDWSVKVSAPVYVTSLEATTVHFSVWTLLSSSTVVDGGPCEVKSTCSYGGSAGGSTTADSGTFMTFADCKTLNTTNDLSCKSINHSDTWTCECVGAPSFELLQDASLSSTQVVGLWESKCVGTCIPQQQPALDAGPGVDGGTGDAAQN